MLVLPRPLRARTSLSSVEPQAASAFVLQCDPVLTRIMQEHKVHTALLERRGLRHEHRATVDATTRIALSCGVNRPSFPQPPALR